MKIYNTQGDLIPDVHDVLCELGNAGVGMVSVTIGRMLQARISIGVPRVTYDAARTTGDAGMDAQRDAIAFFMHMKETMSGDVVFIIEHDFIVAAVAKLTGTKYTFEEMLDDEVGFSAVEEFGNIIGSAYIKAIAGYTGIRVYLSPVMVGVDKPDKLLSPSYTRREGKDGKRILVESEFSMMDADGSTIGRAGHIIMTPDEESVKTLVKALGM